MYKLYNGDCLEVMKDIPDGSIDMILCDLPYGTTACKWDVIIPFEPLWEQYNRIAKEEAAIVLFSTQPFTTLLIHSNLKNYRYNWYWKKNIVTGFSYARFQPMRTIEDICVFYKKTGKYNPVGLKESSRPIRIRNDKNGINGETLNKAYKPKYTGYPNNLLFYSKEFGYHPTQKPVALLEYLIKTYTNENELVLDNCMGSGSTGVAALNTDRRFIGIEKEEKYFEIAKERIAKEGGQ